MRKVDLLAAANYQKKSGDIVSILEDMKDKAEIPPLGNETRLGRSPLRLHYQKASPCCISPDRPGCIVLHEAKKGPREGPNKGPR